MTVSISSPVTGATQTGLTSPTYTVVSDTAPSSNGKQWAVTALGGTQAGVDVSSVSKPFTTTFFKPAALKSLGPLNPVTGAPSSVPANVYKLVTRKGVLPLVGQPNRTMLVTTIIEVPAGADTADAEDIRAGLSLHIGALSQQSSGIGDTVVSGVM
jgi:hypothetical protein